MYKLRIPTCALTRQILFSCYAKNSLLAIGNKETYTTKQSKML